MSLLCNQVSGVINVSSEQDIQTFTEVFDHIQPIGRVRIGEDLVVVGEILRHQVFIEASNLSATFNIKRHELTFSSGSIAGLREIHQRLFSGSTVRSKAAVSAKRNSHHHSLRLNYQ